MNYSQQVESLIGAGRVPTPDRKTSPVDCMIQAQQAALGELHTSITNLEERLRAILTPPQPQPQDVDKAPRERPSQLSRVLEENTEAIGMAIKRLHDIMGRLEI